MQDGSPIAKKPRIAWSATQLRSARTLSPANLVRSEPDNRLSHELAQAFVLRDKLLVAVAEREVDRLGPLLGALAKLSITKDILRRTGLGYLVGDRSIWELAPSNRPAQLAQRLKQDWGTRLKGERFSPVHAVVRKTSPLKGFRSDSFIEQVGELNTWLLTLDDAPLAPAISIKAAVLWS